MLVHSVLVSSAGGTGFNPPSESRHTKNDKNDISNSLV